MLPNDYNEIMLKSDKKREAMDHKAFEVKMRTYTIVYVEDDAAVREHITEFLRRYFKRVDACHSAEEGLRLYREHAPDILILDINLGGMSGIELASQIRQEDSKVRILISTAYTNKEFMLQAIELSLTRYLVKPITSDELVLALEKCWQELQVHDQVILGEGVSYFAKLGVLVREEVSVSLRHKEIVLLEYFIAHEGELVRYEQLAYEVWQEEVMSSDAIRSQIRNLRQKMGMDLFENISGLGYRFQRRSV